MSAYDPSGCGLFPDSYLEEPTRPCDSGEVDHEAQKRADAEHTAFLAKMWAEWHRKHGLEGR